MADIIEALKFYRKLQGCKIIFLIFCSNHKDRKPEALNSKTNNPKNTQ